MRSLLLVCFVMTLPLKAQIQINAQARNDLNFKTNTRVLYTTINNVDAFEATYSKGAFSLKTVLTDYLHTTIVLGHKENLLKAYDGSIYSFPAALTAQALTAAVIEKIGGMYYGSEEVQKLNQKNK